MKLEINRTDLQSAILAASSVAGDRAGLPILTCALLQAEPKSLTITGSNLDTTIQAVAPVRATGKGSACCSAARLSAIARILPDEKVTIEFGDRDTVLIESGASSYKMLGLPADSFPAAPKAEWKTTFTMDRATALNLLRQSSFTVGVNTTRVLDNLLIRFTPGEIRMVGANGHRMSEVIGKLPGKQKGDYLVPGSVTGDIAKILATQDPEPDEKPKGKKPQIPTVEISFGASHMQAAIPGRTFWTKLAEGQYPDYRPAIPDHETIVTVAREELLASVLGIEPMVSDLANHAVLSFQKNLLTITTESVNYGRAQTELALKYSGKPVEIRLNPSLLSESLRVLTGDEVQIGLTDHTSPITIQSGTTTVLIMLMLR